MTWTGAFIISAERFVSFVGTGGTSMDFGDSILGRLSAIGARQAPGDVNDTETRGLAVRAKASDAAGKLGGRNPYHRHARRVEMGAHIGDEESPTVE
jgi:hypothetical protein